MDVQQARIELLIRIVKVVLVTNLLSTGRSHHGKKGTSQSTTDA